SDTSPVYLQRTQGGRMKRTLLAAAVLGVTVLMALVGSAAVSTLAADHLDGPMVMQDGRLDLTDIYAFKHGSNSVLVMDVHPLAGVLSPVTFHPTASYEFKVDNNGDAKEDLTYKI